MNTQNNLCFRLEESSEDYFDQVKRHTEGNSIESDALPNFISQLKGTLRFRDLLDIIHCLDLNTRMRQQLVTLTEKSGVQVEPQRVTKILDKMRDTINNLVMCGVPGAGGDDAVCIHTFDSFILLFIGLHSVLVNELQPTRGQTYYIRENQGHKC